MANFQNCRKKRRARVRRGKTNGLADLIITIHHATEGGKKTGHKDIRVGQHAHETMLLFGIIPTDNGLTDSRFGCFLEDTHNGGK
jgi:hypothetical protein